MSVVVVKKQQKWKQETNGSIALKGICHLNVNKCSFGRFAQTTDTDILLRRTAKKSNLQETESLILNKLVFSQLYFFPEQNSFCPFPIHRAV